MRYYNTLLATVIFLSIAPTTLAAHVTKECLAPFTQELRYADGTRLRRPELASEVQKLQKVLNWDEDSNLWVRARPVGSVGYPGYEGTEYLSRTVNALKDFNKKWGIVGSNVKERTGHIVATSTRTRLNQIIDGVCASTTAPMLSDPVVSNITQNSARISFSTNIPTRAYVVYGPGLNLIASSTTLFGTDHSVLLNGLLQNTTYNYQATAYNNTGVTLSSSVNAFATLAPVATSTTFTLSVVKSGTGSGTVVSSGGAINCGATCSTVVASGTAVTLVETPFAGSTFSGWSGICSSVASTCVMIMTANVSMGATFSAAVATTTANSAPIGPGSFLGPDARVGVPYTVKSTSSPISARDADNNLSSYLWGFSYCPGICPTLINVSGPLSGGMASTTIPVPTFTPNTSGTYYVRLRIIDTLNASTTSTVYVFAATSTAPTTAVALPSSSPQNQLIAQTLQALAEAVERLRQLILYGTR